MKHRVLPVAIWFAALTAPLQAAAGCSRPMVVPLSSTGKSVVIQGADFSGIYPDLLRGMEEKEGCTFVMSGVPRARLELMFESGKADLLIPASKTPKRDEVGHFVPLIQNRATLISVENGRAPVRSLSELLSRQDLRVIAVRGFDYGQAYQEALVELGRLGRLTWEVDPLSVARLLKSGSVDATIMAPVILAGAMQDDARVAGLLDKLRFEPLEELPWGENGAYISKTSLSKDDVQALVTAMTRLSQSGLVWKGFQRYLPAAVLKESVRGR